MQPENLARLDVIERNHRRLVGRGEDQPRLDGANQPFAVRRDRIAKDKAMSLVNLRWQSLDRRRAPGCRKVQMLWRIGLRDGRGGGDDTRGAHTGYRAGQCGERHQAKTKAAERPEQPAPRLVR